MEGSSKRLLPWIAIHGPKLWYQSERTRDYVIVLKRIKYQSFINITNMLSESICYLLSTFKCRRACKFSCFPSLGPPEKFILTLSALQVFPINVCIIRVSCSLCLQQHFYHPKFSTVANFRINGINQTVDFIVVMLWPHQGAICTLITTSSNMQNPSFPDTFNSKSHHAVIPA